MDLNLKGKSALITGGYKGIGRAVADVLAAEGCNLHLAARDAAALETAATELATKFGVKVEAHAADLSERANVEALAATCTGVDFLVNNAGAIPGGTIDAIDDDRWRESWDLKVFGYITMTRAFFRTMSERGAGVIVNIIGSAGQVPDARFICGSTANAALIMLTQSLGAVGIDHGVRVVGVNPGPISTDRMRTMMETKAEAEYGDRSRWRELLSHMPLGRGGTPEEVADVVAFLASERASYVSGTVIPIDGGFSNRGKVF